MTSAFLPSIRQVKQVFVREIADSGGTVTDSFDDDTRLYLRSVLLGTQDIIPGDRVQAGVALRMVDEEVLVYPYVFRQVCRNGAIMAQALEARRVARVEGDYLTPDDDAVREALEEVRSAVSVCRSPEAFAGAVGTMRTASVTALDTALNLMPLLSRMEPEIGARVLSQIFDRYVREDARTAFGLMNAITALARDTRDPEQRWRLEELGGGVPALLRPVVRPANSAAMALRA